MMMRLYAPQPWKGRSTGKTTTISAGCWWGSPGFCANAVHENTMTYGRPHEHNSSTCGQRQSRRCRSRRGATFNALGTNELRSRKHRRLSGRVACPCLRLIRCLPAGLPRSRHWDNRRRFDSTCLRRRLYFANYPIDTNLRRHDPVGCRTRRCSRCVAQNGRSLSTSRLSHAPQQRHTSSIASPVYPLRCATLSAAQNDPKATRRRTETARRRSPEVKPRMIWTR
jgi:hypothetical protein